MPSPSKAAPVRVNQNKRFRRAGLLKQNRVAVFGCMDRPERNIDELPESVTADVFLGVARAGVNTLVVIGLFIVFL
jgi:hypothetical protein